MKIMNGKKDIFTIPNILSVFRIVLAGLLLWIFYNPAVKEKRYFLTFILMISALTDFLDGKIARKFHMVSELGKVLDPIADKITQGVLIICLLSEYAALKPVFLLFIIKESYMAAAGLKVISETNQNEGAMWYGKINTAVFYTVMLLLIFLPNLSKNTANLLIAVSGACMLFSFIMYGRKYACLMKSKKKESKEE